MTLDAARELANLILESGSFGTVVFTGAGVSTASGIPDFRSPGGLWSQYAPINYAEYMSDPAMRREAWRRGVHTYAPLASAHPNPAHAAIAAWWSQGLLNGVVTQNIDGLHQRSGVPDDAIVELHGNAHSVLCLACGARSTRAAVHARLTAGDVDPICLVCGGMLKSTTVSFGQPLPVEAIARAQDLHARARLCVVVGSSLVVYPAALLPEVTLDAGGLLAIVNHTPTHLDGRAAVVARESAASVLCNAQALTCITP
ncbi:MAG: NAD-dependent protein deacetylase [Chloroflexota bacterium]